jgi:hypothetical protein
MQIETYCMFVELRRGEALFHRAAIGEVGIPWKLERNGIRFYLTSVGGDADGNRLRAADITKVKRFDEIVKEKQTPRSCDKGVSKLEQAWRTAVMKKIATNWRRIVAEKREVEWKIEHPRKVQPRILGESAMEPRELRIMKWLRSGV